MCWVPLFYVMEIQQWMRQAMPSHRAFITVGETGPRNTHIPGNTVQRRKTKQGQGLEHSGEDSLDPLPPLV